jgi:hypothetical protein
LSVPFCFFRYSMAIWLAESFDSSDILDGASHERKLMLGFMGYEIIIKILRVVTQI